MKQFPTTLPPIILQTVGLVLLVTVFLIWIISGQFNAALLSGAMLLVASQGAIAAVQQSEKKLDKHRDEHNATQEEPE